MRKGVLLLLIVTILTAILLFELHFLREFFTALEEKVPEKTMWNVKGILEQGYSLIVMSILLLIVLVMVTSILYYLLEFNRR